MSRRDLIGQLYNKVPSNEYAAIRCIACNGIYRWPRRHIWQSSCPYCGAITFKPIEVDRLEYIHWLEMLGTTEAMSELQKVLFNPQYVDG